MVQRAIDDYFPRGYPIQVTDIEVKNGESIPTYFLMKKLEEEYKKDNFEFHFIMGSDLIPFLLSWDCGKELISEINFVIFERKGFESILAIPENERPYPMPEKMRLIKAKENILGVISSTEVRRRITEVKQKAKDELNG